MSKEKKTTRKLKSYEIVEERGSATRPESTVDKLLRQDAQRLAQEAERLQLETIVAERKQRLAAAKQGLGLNPGGSSRERIDLAKALLTDPKVQEQWLKMDEGGRATIMTAANTLTQQGQSASALAQYMPLFMAQQNRNPQTSVKDMVEIFTLMSGGKGRGDDTKTMLEALRTGFDMASKNQPKGTSESIFKETMEFLKPLYDTLSSKDKELYNQQFSFLQGQIQPLSQQIKDATETATAMGFTKGGSTMEIEKMKIDHERWKTEQDWKREEWRDEMKLKKETEKSRWEAITTIGTKWMDKVSPIIDAGITATTGKISGTQQPPTVVQQTGNAVPCTDCGTLIKIKGTPDSVTCPNPECKAVMTRQPMK